MDRQGPEPGRGAAESQQSLRTKTERLLSSRTAHKGAGPNTQTLVCAFVLREKRKLSMDF